MSSPLRALFTIVILLSAGSGLSNAQVVLPKLFGDHMVLQRRMPIHIWGWDEASERVTVSFRGETKTVQADGLGAWSVYLSPGEAGGPYVLTIEGSNTVRLTDILVGDVWVASGQSNMQMPMLGFGRTAPVKDSQEEISAASAPEIRFITLGKIYSDYPQNDIKAEAGWQECSPATVGSLSAVAYFFSRDLQVVEKVPIGLVVSVWGGTWAASWTEPHTLAVHPDLSPYLATWQEMLRGRADELRRNVKEDADTTKSGSPAHIRFDINSLMPGGLYNGMIAPLTPFRIKGVIWYQGESDALNEHPELYSRLFPELIESWRDAWHEGPFPFLYVQISAFGPPKPSPWAVIREAQRRTLFLVNTGMAVSADVGDPNNVHPPDKQTIGSRLALIARAVAYSEQLEFSGPTLNQITFEPRAIRVWFDHANGLQAHGELEGFEVAGSDHKYSKASALIEGTTVLVSSPDVRNPTYVRYGWAASPQMTLFNGAGLPASPFNSDDDYSRQVSGTSGGCSAP